MKISDISIGSFRLGEKKISPKMLLHVESYLSQKGRSIEQLTAEQLKFILRYIRAKRAAKWFPIFMGICGLVLVIFIVYYIPMEAFLVNAFMPDTATIVLEDGTKKVVELDLALIGAYGKCCFLLGCVWVGAAYLAVSAFASLFSFFRNIRDMRKMLDAFLPKVNRAPSSISEGDVKSEFTG